jgi:hypothetical protein
VIPDPPENGLAVMAATGFELRSRKSSAIDFQIRLLRGSYGLSDHVTSVSFGFGFNWY